MESTRHSITIIVVHYQVLCCSLSSAKHLCCSDCWGSGCTHCTEIGLRLALVAVLSDCSRSTQPGWVFVAWDEAHCFWRIRLPCHESSSLLNLAELTIWFGIKLRSFVSDYQHIASLFPFCVWLVPIALHRYWLQDLPFSGFWKKSTGSYNLWDCIS